MKKIIFILVAVFITYTLKPEMFTFLHDKGAFDEMGSPQTLVFTHNKCGKPCVDTIKLLKRRHVEYSVYPLDNNEKNKALWKEYGGINSFPNIIMGNEKEYGSYKSRIVSKLALTYGDSVLSSPEKFYMKKHFYDSGKPRLVMYGASWCQYCKKLRAELDASNIDYEDIDVEKSAKRESMIETLDISGYPLVYFGYKRMEGPQGKDVLGLF